MRTKQRQKSGATLAWFRSHGTLPTTISVWLIMRIGRQLWLSLNTTSDTTTLTPSPTITENRSIPCVSNCTVMIVLDTVTIDTSKQSMRWAFTLSSGQGCSDGELDVYLEDPKGTKYQAGGDVGSGNSTWTIVNGQPLHLVALFAFLPAHGLTYQLFAHVAGFCYTDYQPESFTF